MTEITRVPLQPIARGSVGKLWLGVAAAVLVAGGVAWAVMPAAVEVTTLKAGTGVSPTTADVVLINYKGTLPGGKVFDQAERAVLPLDGVVPGFVKALEQMQRGGKYKVLIPSELGYGNKAAGEIPPNTDLTFEIELIDFRSRAEIEEQQRMMQQMQQGGAGGPPMPGMPQGGPPQGQPIPQP